MAKCMRQRPCTLVQLQVDMTVEYYLPKNVKKIRGSAMVTGIGFDVAFFKNLKIASPPKPLALCTAYFDFSFLLPPRLVVS